MTKATSASLGYTMDATYDAENRLTAATVKDAQSVTLHGMTLYYSGDGFLARQVVDAVETRFVRSGGLVVQERDGSNAVTRSYAWGMDAGGGIGGLLELNRKEGALWKKYSYLYDGKGNVSAVIDSAQVVVASYSYDPYGNLVTQTTTVGFDQPYMFSTKRYYAGYGLYDFGYRFYSPSLGRWINRDPMGEGGGLNLYCFVANSPLAYYDPYGLFVPQLIGGVIGAAIGGYAAYKTDGYTADGKLNTLGILRSAAVGGAAGVLSTVGIPGMSPILSSTLTGAFAGASANIALQSLSGKSLTELDVRSIGYSATAGAIGGFVGASTAKVSLGKSILKEATIAGSKQISSYPPMFYGQNEISAAIGGMIGGIFDAFFNYDYDRDYVYDYDLIFTLIGISW